MNALAAKVAGAFCILSRQYVFTSTRSRSPSAPGSADGLKTKDLTPESVRCDYVREPGADDVPEWETVSDPFQWVAPSE